MGAVRVAVVAATLVLSATPVHAASDGRALTLTGTESGYVDVTFTSNARFYADTSIKKTGQYAGWVVQRLSDGQVLLGNLLVNGWSGQITVARTTGGQVASPAGTYRFYLVTDRSATVRIRVTGLGRSRTLTPTGPVTAAAGAVTLGDAPIVTHHTPVTSSGRTLFVVATRHASTAGAVVRPNACVRKTRTEECDPVTASVAVLNAVSSVGTMRFSWPGETGAGPWFAVHQVQAVSVQPSVSGVWFSLDTRT